MPEYIVNLVRGSETITVTAETADMAKQKAALVMQARTGLGWVATHVWQKPEAVKS